MHPITLGHLDILSRAARCFDKVYMCVMVNCEKKQPMFSQEKRLELIPPLHRPYPQCRGGAVLRPAGGLRRQKNAHIIVKGVRNITDFDSEMQMARINQGIEPELETLLLPARAEFEHFSSTMAREMIRYGQPLTKYVPAPVAEELMKGCDH